MAQPFARYGKLVAPFVCGNYGVLMKHCVTLQSMQVTLTAWRTSVDETLRNFAAITITLL